GLRGIHLGRSRWRDGGPRARGVEIRAHRQKRAAGSHQRAQGEKDEEAPPRHQTGGLRPMTNPYATTASPRTPSAIDAAHSSLRLALEAMVHSTTPACRMMNAFWNQVPCRSCRRLSASIFSALVL